MNQTAFASTLRKAIATYGERQQIDMAIEECAELITVLCHDRRMRASSAQIITEIADVKIMIQQLEYIFGAEAVAAEVEVKVARLARKLEG